MPVSLYFAYAYTYQGLRNYFSEFGKVDACTIVRDADGKSRGFAFLTFEEPASVNAVHDPGTLPGRKGHP
ncbi:hypothetical protein EDB83DRAFT_2410008, partial [Lactarius deliciosus]